MMTEKDCIRRYEELKGEKIETVEEALVLERKWLDLHLEAQLVFRKLPSKQKKPFQVFVKRSYENAWETSSFIFFQLLPKDKQAFAKSVKTYKRLYERHGTKILFEKYAIDNKQKFTFESLLQEYVERKKQKEVSTEEWIDHLPILKGQVEHVSTIKEALTVEKELLKHSNILNENTRLKQILNDKHNGKQCDIYNLIQENANKIMEFLGYKKSIEEFVKYPKRLKALRNKGFFALLEGLSSEETQKMVNEVLQHIHLNHPKDDFPAAREMKRHFVFHIGPTNSGKTYQAVQHLKTSASGFYLAPLRLLALETYDSFKKENILCHLRTGDLEIIESGAKHQSLTIESLSYHTKVETAVIDEIQMIQDPDRGFAWLRAICGVQAETVHVCGAPHVFSFVKNIIEECGDTYEVHRYERQTPLRVDQTEFQFPHSVQKGDALIAFSKKSVLNIANQLQEAGYKTSIIYGKMPPNSKKEQVALFANGEIDVVVSTDAIGIGLNLPIKRIIFMETEKFDGKKERKLNIQEVKQIAGRAGRKGLYPEGYVTSYTDKDFVVECLHTEEEDVTKSVISPTIELCDIPVGTLTQKLLAWKKAPIAVPYLKKVSIEPYINLLKHVQKWEHEIGTRRLFKTLFVPFDTEQQELVKQWAFYVEELKDGKDELTKPTVNGNSVTALEVYFQKLNLYYSFSKKFKLTRSKNWVKYEKKRVTEQINQSFRLKYA